MIVGRDARHGSAIFATVTAEVLAAEGFSVLLLPGPVPTPVVAFAVRHTGAAAGIQITASHNPRDRQRLQGVLRRRHPDRLPHRPPDRNRDGRRSSRRPDRPRARRTRPPPTWSSATSSVRPGCGALDRFGAGGPDTAARGGRCGGRRDAAPGRLRPCAHRRCPIRAGPRLPHRRVPESRGARCHRRAARPGRRRRTPTSRSRWTPTPTAARSGYPTGSGWRMLSGDETGWLLGDYILSQTDIPEAAAETRMVASTVVSSRMLAAIAAHYGAIHVETLTGFKWLARADANLPTGTLVYAYEEAIGHCVDPAAVRDKDGISAAVLVCDLVAALKEQGRSVPERLDELARALRRARSRGGVASSRRRRRGRRPDAAAAGSPAGPAGRLRRSTDHRHHRRADLHRRRRRHVGPGGGAALGNRAEAEVLLGGSLRGGRRPAARPATGAARCATNWSPAVRGW